MLFLLIDDRNPSPELSSPSPFSGIFYGLKLCGGWVCNFPTLAAQDHSFPASCRVFTSFYCPAGSAHVLLMRHFFSRHPFWFSTRFFFSQKVTLLWMPLNPTSQKLTPCSPFFSSLSTHGNDFGDVFCNKFDESGFSASFSLPFLVSLPQGGCCFYDSQCRGES